MTRIPDNGDPKYAKFQGEVADDFAILGLLATDPTSGTAQAAGTGATTWNINVTAGDVVVGAVKKNYQAQTNFSVHASTMLVSSGQGIYARLVEKNDTGTLSMVVVKGTAATIAAEVEPTDAEVETALGAGVTWRDLALLYLKRTADTTLVQTQDNMYRTKTRRSIAP